MATVYLADDLKHERKVASELLSLAGLGVPPHCISAFDLPIAPQV